ncbi:MAG TPA: DUF3536 domain-containing protein [Terriglobales bacterium]
MDRYICIHCHFYQPPRENPWLEIVEQQDSAYPFHDWNERITAECYAPNGASRVLDGAGYITQIVNNYSRINFNFGPTLLSWLEANMPEVYRSILTADRDSKIRFSGHGSAIAQVYNHMILPLANSADKWTQIYWGKKDFEHRFKRAPEGMWLAETAVDLETLDYLAKQGIKYTILAPSQAGRVRRLHGGRWKDVGGGQIDPTRAYLQKLPEGRSIALFFYDGPISRAVAFERLLDSGEQFAQRLISGFNDHREWPQIMHIATDGESYGHHHKHGDMALAYALKYIEDQKLAKLVNYGEYLEKHPPGAEVQIIERTAWSCSHGVERWNSDCGCNSGGHGDWNQAWRGPLREALDWLRDEAARRYEYAARPLLRDPWAARNEYIRVILDRSPDNIDRFFRDVQRKELNQHERVKALKLLELQRHAMLMYTSCGWFFDEISGLETVQVIQYAGRVIQLAVDLFADAEELETGFLERLANAKSNLREHRDGAEIYRKWVKPAVVGLKQIAAHYAIRSLVAGGRDDRKVYSYQVEPREVHGLSSGRVGFAAGVANVQSCITQEQADLSYGVIHFGDHNVNAGVRDFGGMQNFNSLVHDLSVAFNQADLPSVVRLLDQHFQGVTYSLKSLVGDEQKRIINAILNTTMVDAEASFRNVYENHAQLMRFLAENHLPMPAALRTTATFILEARLRRSFEQDFIDLDEIRGLIQQARQLQLNLDTAGLGYNAAESVTRLMGTLTREPENTGLMQKLISVLDLVREMSFPVDLWRAQNIYFELLHNVEPRFQKETEANDWIRTFRELGDRLKLRMEALAETSAALPLAA